MPTPNQAILGCLLGTAVGDSLGLPYEALSRRRVAALGPVRHRFLLGGGMLSDDTEHTLMLAASLIESGTDLDRLQRDFGWRLRWWFLGLPAGIGLSTAKAILRLWIGFPASRSGVRSAGNGSAMRSAIIGALHPDEPSHRRQLVIASCRVTHTDPRAEEAATLDADAAALAANGIPTPEVLAVLKPLLTSPEMLSRFAGLETALRVQLTVQGFAAEIGCERGVSGFAPNTVAVALYAWLRHRGDFSTAIRSVIECGGDTDSVAAIAGGICGTEVGEVGIPADWIRGIRDWPRSKRYLREMAQALAEGRSSAPRFFWPGILPRNFLFFVAVLLHGIRRLWL